MPPQELHERFLRESRASAQLRHPGIVAILDFGVDAERQPYMVMELLSGPSLADEIDLQAPMAPARVAAVIGEVAAAVQLAHDRGITHRDLKPANIVRHRYDVGAGAYKVIDFGLAVITSTRDSTRGSPIPTCSSARMSYAAPEQIRGDADHRRRRRVRDGGHRVRDAHGRPSLRRHRQDDPAEPGADGAAREAQRPPRRAACGGRRGPAARACARIRSSAGPRSPRSPRR